LSNFAGSSRTTKCLISVCVLLVFMSAAVQALHLHPAGFANELKNCPVCHLANSTVLAVLIFLLLFVHRTATFAPAAEVAGAKTIFCSFALFSRPPPTA
jgi:hypothetical protein